MVGLSEGLFAGHDIHKVRDVPNAIGGKFLRKFFKSKRAGPLCDLGADNLIFSGEEFVVGGVFGVGHGLSVT